MKLKKIICVSLLAALLLAMGAAQAATLERAWMEYEDYSGGRAEQSVEDASTLQLLEAILKNASGNPDKLDSCTMNCTLFCLTTDGDIYDFACATDGCPYIQNRANGDTCNLGVDYQRFWEIFSKIRDGMGLEASAVFNW